MNQKKLTFKYFQAEDGTCSLSTQYNKLRRDRVCEVCVWRVWRDTESGEMGKWDQEFQWNRQRRGTIP